MPVAPWQPTQIIFAGSLSPVPSATMPFASCGAGWSSGTFSNQYQVSPVVPAFTCR
jgi:hypothetical protein